MLNAPPLFIKADSRIWKSFFRRKTVVLVPSSLIEDCCFRIKKKRGFIRKHRVYKNSLFRCAQKTYENFQTKKISIFSSNFEDAHFYQNTKLIVFHSKNCIVYAKTNELNLTPTVSRTVLLISSVPVRLRKVQLLLGMK